MAIDVGFLSRGAFQMQVRTLRARVEELESGEVYAGLEASKYIQMLGSG